MLVDIAQHPIFGVIIASFIIILVITESILREKLLRNRLTFSFFNIAAFVVLIFFYNTEIYPNETYLLPYVVYLYLNYAIFLLALYQTFKNAIVKGSQYQLFIKGIKNTKWNIYYVVDAKERIKDISNSLLRELNLERDEVIGKRISSVFSSKIRFTKMNENNINNKDLENYFNEYKKSVKPSDSERLELHFQNYRGDTVILNLNLLPIFVLGKYRGRMVVGEKRTDESLMSVEKELKETDNELESIRHKFIATMELTEEGLFYIDLEEKTIWLNDIIMNNFKYQNQTLPLENYRELIDKEDLKKYLSSISNLTPSNPTYQTTYRLLVDSQYIWVKEKGKRLFDDHKYSVIMGVITPLKHGHFRKTNIEQLDNVKDENYLIPELQQLIKSGRPFQLAIINLSNIPYINETHGRGVGNMLMAQYITKLKQTFVTESSELYRLSGLEFAFTITDNRKMALLQTGLKADETYLDMTMEYGSITAELTMNIGIAQMYEDAINAQDLYQNAMLALKTAKLPQFKGQGCYFKEIK